MAFNRGKGEKSRWAPYHGGRSARTVALSLQGDAGSISSSQEMPAGVHNRYEWTVVDMSGWRASNWMANNNNTHDDDDGQDPNSMLLFIRGFFDAIIMIEKKKEQIQLFLQWRGKNSPIICIQPSEQRELRASVCPCIAASKTRHGRTTTS